MRSGIVTLTTDFGEASSYVAQMKGVLLAICPYARLVDVSHGVPAQAVAEAAFMLFGFYRHFSPGTVHLVVVDPGVGTERACLAARAGQWLFVAPDNGVLTYVLQQEGRAEIVTLSNPRYWRSDVSSTFHGRDIFAPVAAHLLCGVSLKELGDPLQGMPVLLPPLKAHRTRSGAVEGQVVHVDRFGNLISSIARDDVARLVADPAMVCVQVRGETLHGLQRTYGERQGGSLIALFSSFDLLEVACVGGSAAALLGAAVGDTIIVEMAGGE